MKSRPGAEHANDIIERSGEDADVDLTEGSGWLHAAKARGASTRSESTTSHFTTRSLSSRTKDVRLLMGDLRTMVRVAPSITNYVDHNDAAEP